MLADVPIGNRRRGITRDVVVAMGAALLINGAIFGLGWGQTTATAVRSRLDPPGWVVGVVWLLLFSLMGAAHGLLRQESDEQDGLVMAREARWIVGLLLLCLVYPLYTLGLSSEKIALAGNIVTGICAALLVWRVWPRSRAAALCLLPTALWLAFATILIADTLRIAA